MATYYYQSNNGVTAVVTEQIYKKMEERLDLLRECERKNLPRPQLPPILPVFTFSSPDHPAIRYMTGTSKAMSRLLEGQDLKSGSIWVPFSNGIQWRQDESAVWELEFMTTLDEVFDAFPHLTAAQQ